MILYVLSGLPGAGKSTMARLLAHQTSAVLVARDELRRELVNLHDEGVISAVMAEIVRVLLCSGRDVVVDAWNLHESDEQTWRGIAAQYGAQLEWRHLATPVDVCVDRDHQRPLSIGGHAVRSSEEAYRDRLLVLAGMAVEPPSLQDLAGQLAPTL